MRDLQPLSAYQNASTVGIVRPTLVLGLLWGIPMTMFMLRTHQGTVGFVVAVCAIGAVLFGSLVTLLARFASRQLTQQVYYCVWPIVPAAPPGQYDARLMCRLKRGRLTIGGHLYIGAESWVFVPHTKNGPFYRQPVRWAQPAALSLSARDPRRSLLSWLFGSTPHDQLVISDGNRGAVFLVPNAADIISAMNQSG